MLIGYQTILFVPTLDIISTLKVRIIYITGMPFSIRRSIFAHCFLNPPQEQKTCNVEIKVCASNSQIELVKSSSESESQTKFDLEIKDSSVLDISEANQANGDKIVKNLVLAFNLVISRSCISILSGDLPSTETKSLPARVIEKVFRKESGPNKSVVIVDSIGLVDSVSVVLTIVEELNVEHALNYFKLITKINRHSPNPAFLVKANIGKALNEFENAMSAFDKLRIFKYLFNTVEFCANYKGTDLKGDPLDFAIATYTHLSKLEIKEWRMFYNLTKHVDRSSGDTIKFIEDSKKLDEILPRIREAAKIMLIECLNAS